MLKMVCFNFSLMIKKLFTVITLLLISSLVYSQETQIKEVLKSVDSDMDWCPKCLEESRHSRRYDIILAKTYVILTYHIEREYPNYILRVEDMFGNKVPISNKEKGQIRKIILTRWYQD